MANITGTNAIAVTPSNSAPVAAKSSSWIWVGGAGNLAVTMANGANAVFTAVPAGTALDIRVSYVLTSTTATNIVAVY